MFDEDNLQVKDENPEKALNLALNKISGEWDYAKMDLLFEDLQGNNFNMELTGFDMADLWVDSNMFESDLELISELEEDMVSKDSDDLIKEDNVVLAKEKAIK